MRGRKLTAPHLKVLAGTDRPDREVLEAEFESRALDELSRAARRHLRTGQTPEQIGWQLGL